MDSAPWASSAQRRQEDGRKGKRDGALRARRRCTLEYDALHARSRSPRQKRRGAELHMALACPAGALAAEQGSRGGEGAETRIGLTRTTKRAMTAWASQSEPNGRQLSGMSERLTHFFTFCGDFAATAWGERATFAHRWSKIPTPDLAETSVAHFSRTPQPLVRISRFSPGGV